MSRANQSQVEVNPYAAPAVPDALFADRELHLGAWRDGNRLVVHRQCSVLPPLCLLTGLPARRYHGVRVSWSYPIDISTRTLRIDVALSEPAFASRRRWQWRSALVSICAVAAVCGLANSADLLPTAVFPVLMTLAMAMLVTAPIVCVFKTQLLSFKKVRGDYLWLSGAAPQFLAQLPPWLGGR